MVLRLLTER
uniref:Uncharacterized protein n=1 Tax=Anguilla anguilla TaxID=7936 RepID=A0A0E9V9D2_ANGAN